MNTRSRQYRLHIMLRSCNEVYPERARSDHHEVNGGKNYRNGFADAESLLRRRLHMSPSAIPLTTYIRTELPRRVVSDADWEARPSRRRRKTAKLCASQQELQLGVTHADLGLLLLAVTVP